jgi:ABC-type lipoprotein release transport system permease subunit
MDFVVHSRPHPIVLANALKETVQLVNQNDPISAFFTIDSQIERLLRQNQNRRTILIAHEVLNFTLSTAGIFAVVSLAVRESTREIGIRTALRALRSTVVIWIIKKSLRLVFSGTGIGCALASIYEPYDSRIRL